MEVECLKEKDITKYYDFIKEVFDYEINTERAKELINKNKVLMIKKDEKIIASLVLEEKIEYIKNQKYYILSYLGVLKEYRKKGYANKLFSKVEELVRKNNINYIELNSGNQRRDAYYFYRSKNFKIKDTTVFIKIY